jgi:hypothetical protein
MGVRTANPATTETVSPTARVGSLLAAWYAPGFVDTLGDRLLLCDTSGNRPLEMLRFTPALADASRFEAILRERTDQLRPFHHPALATVRRIDRVADHTGGLVVVSDHVPGHRLTQLLEASRTQRLVPDPALAVWVIHELLAALDELHRAGSGVAHGTVSPERIVITTDGRLVITEYVVGAALESLALTSRELWQRFHVPAPAGAGAVHFSPATDLLQTGATALAVLLGRTLYRHEYPDALPQLLNDACRIPGRHEDPLLRLLRDWLSRALWIQRDRQFRSLQEACAALPHVAGSAARPLTTPQRLEDTGGVVETRLPLPAGPPAALAQTGQEEGSQSRSLVLRGSAPPRAAWTRSMPLRVAALAVVALAEAALLAFYVSSPSRVDGKMRSGVAGAPSATRREDVSATVQAPVLVATSAAATAQGRLRVESDPAGILLAIDGRAAGRTPINIALQVGNHEVELHGRSGVVRKSVAIDASTTTILMTSLSDPAPLAPAGWLAVSAPFTVELYVNGKRAAIGRSERISLAPGRHSISLVNEELAFRTIRDVRVRAGETVTLPVVAPTGSLSVNALPWAEVWLNGQRIGETPLAALPVSVGHHEVLFSHPEHGSQRRLVTVQADAETRVGVDLRK